MRRTSASLALFSVGAVLLGLDTPASARVRDDDDVFNGDEYVPYDYDYDHEVRPFVVITVDPATVDARLASADLEGCLETLVGPHTAAVRVRVPRDGRARVRVSVSPRDAAAETCVRQAAGAALEWNSDRVEVPRPVRTRLVVRSTGRERTTGAGREAVDAALASVRDALVACVSMPDAPVTGTLGITLRVRRSGTLVLRRARVGRLIPGDETSACLREVVGALAVEASDAPLDLVADVPL